MSRGVYLGGFGNGKTLAEDVRVPLADAGNYDETLAYTYAYASTHPEEVGRAVDGAEVLTHSAGFLAAHDMRPSIIRAVGAPLPSGRLKIMGRTISKSGQMLGHAAQGREAMRHVNHYNASALGELGTHLYANLSRVGTIAKADSVKLAVSATQAGVPVEMFYNRQDRYFQPSPEQYFEANAGNVPLTIIEGLHDQLPLYPEETLQQIFV